MKKKPFRWADASAIAIGMCVWAGVAVAEPGPTWIEIANRPALPEGGIAAVGPYQIPAAYWPVLQDLVRGNPNGIPKTAHPWPVDLPVLRVPQNKVPLVCIAQLMGSVGAGDSGWGYTDEDLLLVNDIALAAGVGVTLNTSPYHRAKWCNDDPLDWSDTGNEIAFTAQYLQKCKVLGLRVNCVQFDSECYKSPHPLVTERLNIMYGVAKLFYPDVPLRWYRNGDWAPNIYATHDDNQGLYQYRTYSAPYTEGWLNRWEWKLPNQYGVAVADSFTPWISLGPGYRDGRWQWKLGLDDLEYEYLARMHIADDRIRDVSVFPHPCRPICMPGSIEAFIAYARGALSLE